MPLLQCEMCTGDLEISTDKSIGVCKYCGSTFTIPKELEKKGNLFNRASYLRQNCNFDKAIDVYESILSEDCEDADALWGLVLCRYGIEFVEDPHSGSRIPTCHRASRTSILLDPDFKSAMQHADEQKSAVYYENALRIDKIQKEILSMSNNQEKFEVFICYKESDENGERTQDSVIAQDLYNELTRMKIKTFFARKTLEGKLGASYEPIIYSALTSAKIMVVLGTKPEYFEATWVKNEWSRYLGFMEGDDSKILIPAFRNMSAYQLPEEFMAIQAVDMSKLGFMQDLCDGIKKILHKNGDGVAEAASPVSKESLYSRAMVFLGNREFYKAVDYFDKVLDIEPQYARAYWGSLLASYQCVSNQELIEYTAGDWTDDSRLYNALRFANEEEKKIYELTIEKRAENFKNLAMSAMEAGDFDKCLMWCEKSLKQNDTDGSMWWVKLLVKHHAHNSNELYESCLAQAVSVLDDEAYIRAVEHSIPEEAMMYTKAGNRIDQAVKDKRRDIAYDQCTRYMEKSLRQQNRTRKEAVAAQWHDYESEMDTLNHIRRIKGGFFRNNLFILLFELIFWAIGTFTAMRVVLGEDAMTMWLFGVIYGIIVFILLVARLSRYVKQKGLRAQAVQGYKKMERVIREHHLTAARAIDTENRMIALFENFEKNPEMAIEEIRQARCEFAKVFGDKDELREGELEEEES